MLILGHFNWRVTLTADFGSLYWSGHFNGRVTLTGGVTLMVVTSPVLGNVIVFKAHIYQFGARKHQNKKKYDSMGVGEY